MHRHFQYLGDNPYKAAISFALEGLYSKKVLAFFGLGAGVGAAVGYFGGEAPFFKILLGAVAAAIPPVFLMTAHTAYYASNPPILNAVMGAKIGRTIRTDLASVVSAEVGFFLERGLDRFV